MKKKGFTLVELLAVIVVLGVILSFTTIKIQSTVKNAKKKVIAATAYNIIKVNKERVLDTADYGEIDVLDSRLNYDGEKPTKGFVSTNKDGDSKIVIEMNKFCAYKNYSDKEVTITDLEGSYCETIGGISSYIQNLYINDSERVLNGLEITDDGNLRYVGANPNNYVTFNGKLWRIIGIFSTTNSKGIEAKRVKIVRDKSLISASWDSSESNINKGYGVNEWSLSDIKVLLNGYYLSGGVCKFCNGGGQAVCEKECNFLSLGENKNMIEEIVWNTSALILKNNLTAYNAYIQERGNTGGKACVGTTYENGMACSDTVERTTTWTGKVGLIYPSDYVYASTKSECRNNVFNSETFCKDLNWLYNGLHYWTITPYANEGGAYSSWSIYSTGIVDYYGNCGGYDVRPSLYLKSNVKITTGTGTSTDPYQLSI